MSCLKRKNLLAALAAVVMITAMPAAMASASSAAAGTVRVGTYLNVRSAGNTGAPVIGKLYNGAQVTILDTVNGWDKISYGGKTGWISGLYVTSSQAQIAVDAAKSQLGVAYRYGGATPYQALDCSGLTMYAYEKAGVSLPHSSAAQSTRGWQVSRNDLRPGDLLFFDTDGGSVNVTHCGIYIGNDTFISAQSGAGKVKEATLSSSYWSKAFVTARRIVG